MTNPMIQRYHGRPVPPVQPKQQSSESVPQQGSKTSFQQMLHQQLRTTGTGELKVSHHATVRMQQRGIELDAMALERLNQAVQQAATKGAKDALILMDQQAFIVNIQNRTMVTAMDANDLKDHVVTQIDSAVIIPTTK